MKDEYDFSKATKPIGQISWKSWREQDVGHFLRGYPYFLITTKDEADYLWALDTGREDIKDYRYKFLEQGKFSDLMDKGNALMDALPPLPRLVEGRWNK
jgi:hypothetical protein